MIEVYRTSDVVLLSFLRALLADGGIESAVFDGHISALEARIGAFPCRLMVPSDMADAARAILRESGYEPSK
jgi:hypothetical protein